MVRLIKKIDLKKVAILQSNYIPWKGYFDIIGSVDEFIIYDEVQYTKRDWRNRNLIKTKEDVKWLSIPVQVKGKYLQKISETKVDDNKWAQHHWSVLCQNYSKAPYFKTYNDFFEDLYMQCSNEVFLSNINYLFIKNICKILGITSRIRWSSEFTLSKGKTEKLIELCEQTNATHYLSGPSAKNYIQDKLFVKTGIVLEWMNYEGYPEYPQLYPPFEHGVSIVDLLFNAGPAARNFMKSK